MNIILTTVISYIALKVINKAICQPIIKRCVKWFSGNTQPPTQRTTSTVLPSRVSLPQRQISHGKTVLHPTAFYHQSTFPKNFSPRYSAVANKLTETYPFLLNPTGDGNCGIWSLLAILKLSAQENDAIRQNIFHTINEQRQLLSMGRSSTLPLCADSAFDDHKRIAQGLTHLETLFSDGSYISYSKFQNELNQNEYLSETVALAFRFLSFQMHKTSNNTPKLFDLIASNQSGKPKVWLDHYTMMSALRLFGILNVPLYAMTVDQKGQADRNGNTPYTLWEESNLKDRQTTSNYCVILNDNHYQVLSKNNPDFQNTAVINSNNNNNKPQQVQQPVNHQDLSSNQPQKQETHEDHRSKLTKILDNPQETPANQKKAVIRLLAIYCTTNIDLEVKRRIAMTIGTHERNQHLNIGHYSDFFKLDFSTQRMAFIKLLP